MDEQKDDGSDENRFLQDIGGVCPVIPPGVPGNKKSHGGSKRTGKAENDEPRLEENTDRRDGNSPQGADHD